MILFWVWLVIAVPLALWASRKVYVDYAVNRKLFFHDPLTDKFVAFLLGLGWPVVVPVYGVWTLGRNWFTAPVRAIEARRAKLVSNIQELEECLNGETEEQWRKVYQESIRGYQEELALLGGRLPSVSPEQQVIVDLKNALNLVKNQNDVLRSELATFLGANAQYRREIREIRAGRGRR